MVDGALDTPYGKGREKVHATSVSLADGGTHDTGLQEIDSVNVTASGAGHIGAITSISGSTITLSLLDDAGAAVTAAETIYIDAKGT